MEAVYALLGTILGFVLSEISQFIRDNRTESRKEKALRKILKSEFEFNLLNIRKYKAEIDKIIVDEIDPKIMRIKKARRIIDILFPGIRNIVFEGQLENIATLLHKDEVERSLSFHELLRIEESFRNEFHKSYKQQKDEWDLASGGSGMVSIDRSFGLTHKLDKSAIENWDEYYGILCRIIESGNPIRK
jgi:hypothetical protein